MIDSRRNQGSLSSGGAQECQKWTIKNYSQHTIFKYTCHPLDELNHPTFWVGPFMAPKIKGLNLTHLGHIGICGGGLSLGITIAWSDNGFPFI